MPCFAGANLELSKSYSCVGVHDTGERLRWTMCVALYTDIGVLNCELCTKPNVLESNHSP